MFDFQDNAKVDANVSITYTAFRDFPVNSQSGTEVRVIEGDAVVWMGETRSAFDRNVLGVGRVIVSLF